MRYLSKDKPPGVINDTNYVTPLMDISRKSKTLQIFFNNHAKGNTAVTANKLMLLIAEE